MKADRGDGAAELARDGRERGPLAEPALEREAIRAADGLRTAEALAMRLAAASPARVRSRIMASSNSAKEDAHLARGVPSERNRLEKMLGEQQSTIGTA